MHSDAPRHAARDAQDRRAGTRFWCGLTPWFVAYVAVMAYVGYSWYHRHDPEAAPACREQGTIESVELAAYSLARSHGIIAAPRLQTIREVGYASAHRQRGCVGTLKVAEQVIPFAYIVAPRPDDPSRMAVMGADQLVVETRFGNIGPDGDFANNAMPIGRAKLLAAIRSGVDGMQWPGFGANQPQSLPLIRGINPARQHEIADVEPIGACSASTRNGSYTCQLLIERKDPALMALGVERTQHLRGEFTFELDQASRQWRVAADFTAAFSNALSAASPR